MGVQMIRMEDEFGGSESVGEKIKILFFYFFEF